jgi:carbon monoxide dehydrogenase subunit G
VELVNEFRVPVVADEAWKVLTDIERVAPCIPGAQLLSVDGDDFTGAVKVKVGPITVSYRGEATFQEKDAAAQRVVIKAVGKETRGSGTAAALVTAQLTDEGDATGVVITTDLTISGKAAQFGRGVLADVSSSLIAEFSERLKANLLGGAAATDERDAAGTDALAAQPVTAQEPGAGESVNLLKLVAMPMAKRAAPVAGGLAAGAAIGFLLGRRSRSTRPNSAAVRAEDILAALSRLAQ